MKTRMSAVRARIRIYRSFVTPRKSWSTSRRRFWCRPQWGKPLRVDVAGGEGGHGGGDKRLLDDVFVGGQSDPLGRAADHTDGAMSILTGIAANQSFATGLPVQVSTLVRF